jgi:hypothetical protein
LVNLDAAAASASGWNVIRSGAATALDDERWRQGQPFINQQILR